MKILKTISAVALLLIGVFSFSKAEKTTPKSSLNLEEVNITQILSSEEKGCRPSSEVFFYVDTKLVKKSRGCTTINASIYVLDRVSGQSNLLANENIVVPSYKDAVLHYDTIPSTCNKIELTNGDKIVGSEIQTPYCFNELIQYKTIYKSYNNATNKLLHIDRTL
ncbi:hypothetical protein SAMN05216503_2214 [Polaribacter sp. KT25b]|uniref:hypothetical protein n=1 Tax=Polaribacter sp. KT25b TaxID=1855336 RepID=UPI00087C0F14|nr:hypothetical protein [Polaribacter sp. KT25b]SDS17476.1 hypothetical protein SAMN05216503_2214 [Polaribacter sp. KT25b]